MTTHWVIKATTGGVLIASGVTIFSGYLNHGPSEFTTRAKADALDCVPRMIATCGHLPCFYTASGPRAEVPGPSMVCIPVL